MAQRSEKKKIKDPVMEAKMFKRAAEREIKYYKQWQENWKWLLDEYENLEKLGRDLTENSEVLEHLQGVKEDADERSVLPIPQTTNGRYGWLAHRDEFSLKFCGRDVFQPMKLPEEYVLLKDTSPFTRH